LMIGIVGLMSLNGCNAANQAQMATASPPMVLTSTPTWTPLPPTATPEPLALLVNGEGILLVDYQAEMERFRAATGTELATEEQQVVSDDFINQLLLAQAAQASGYIVDEEMLQERIKQLTDRMDDSQTLEDWLAVHGYPIDTFSKDLKRAMAAAWMRDKIIEQVPLTAEQVRARQILLYNSAQANEVYAQLQAGKVFATLAAQYDAITYGDLGWFPRGYLLDEKLDEIVFGLQPGEYSQVIQTFAGYHIVQVIERDPQRLLEPDALLALQSLALNNWLQEQRSLSQIEVYVP